MKNLANSHATDDEIRATSDIVEQELREAGVDRILLSQKITGEVPTRIYGELNGWVFERAWYYWVVESKNGMPLTYAKDMYDKYKKLDIRVDGHCGNPAPKGVVYNYHVDTEAGLNVLVKYIKKQDREN